ncbi:MAG: metallophosphoesterase [Candidatus Gastranaerophilales bacterium]|nr:metallophosphoesterase [Candidatus Gastranaerophilales bacterium]
MVNKTINISLLIIILLLAFYAFFIEPNNLEVTNYKIKDKDLAGIKIVYASDFHIKPHQNKQLKNIVEKINAQNPDIILFGGDFVSGHIPLFTMPIEKIALGLSEVRAKYGVYSCIGNHDLWFNLEDVTSALEKNNIKVLYNQNAKIKTDKKEIFIAGLQYKPLNLTPMTEALKDTKSPTILLTHSPDEFPDVPQNVNLTLAGHTHGGQVRLPFFGAILTASEYGQRYVYGLIEEDNKKMIVSKGIGLSILPFRFMCKPEIVVVEFI